MRYDYKRVTTGDQVVTTAVMKNYLKESYGTDAVEDALVVEFINSARLFVEDETRRAFVAQTITFQASDDEAITELLLPYQPIISITSVHSIDVEGTETELTLNTNYNKVGMTGGTETTLLFNRFISTVPVGVVDTMESIRVIYSAGYADNADIPRDVVVGIMKLAAENYVNRESSVDWSISQVPYDVQTMINHYKVYDV